MVVRPATFLLLATLAAAAGGAGSWLAVRQNRADATAEHHSAVARTDPGRVGPATVAAAGPAAAPAPLAAPVPVTAAPKPAAAALPAPDPPVVRVPAVPATRAPAEAAPPAAVPETRPVVPETAADPPLEADAASRGDHLPADAPPTIPAPDVAWRSASSDLPLVDGWVRSTASAGPVDPEPLPVDQLVISADSVIGLQVETTVSSTAAELEDDVDARVTRHVMVGDRIAIAAGTPVRGSVVLVEQAGKLRGTPRLGIRFHTAIMDDGAELPIATETVYREGPARGSESTRRIGGGAVGGAILGAIFGGRRGAAIGSAAGAAGGTAMAIAHDGPPASFSAGASVTIRLLNPTTVRVDRLRPGSR